MEEQQQGVSGRQQRDEHRVRALRRLDDGPSVAGRPARAAAQATRAQVLKRPARLRAPGHSGRQARWTVEFRQQCA